MFFFANYISAYIKNFLYYVRFESSCIFNCSAKSFNVFTVSSIKLITLAISTSFWWWPLKSLETISSFFEYYVSMFDANALLPYFLSCKSFLRYYYTSCFNCSIWSFNDYSSFCFVDKFDLSGTFLSILLMFIDSSIGMVSWLLGWILVSLYFLFITVLILLYFNMSE